MRRRDLQLVGYFPKKSEVPKEWSASRAVSQICSVSHCIASAPPGWIDHWQHNEWGFFNTPMDARSVVPSGADGFSMFAYRLLPVRFIDAGNERLGIDELPVEPLTSEVISLGFDVTNKDVCSTVFGCSPLSCTSMAQEIPVNQFCLLHDLKQAVEVAERFSRGECEPGPYYVLEVLRQLSSSSSGDQTPGESESGFQAASRSPANNSGL